jgi:predicted metalloprotease
MSGRRSENIEDRRGAGGVGGMPIALGGGLGTVVLLVLALFFGFDPSVILQDAGEPTSPPPVQTPSASPTGDPTKDFVSVVLADTEDTWHDLFRRLNREYREPKLVLFNGAVQSACGMAGSAVGPFYCPGDEKLYLDLSFFRALRERFRAPGDFAQAYVIAHEVGHHVQNLLGLMNRRGSGRGEADTSVRRELQADCFAGVWAHHADASRQILEAGDVEEALAAASAIGDDRLQREAGRRVSPETFTHGTSGQRVRWFKRGLTDGEPRRCDTFAAGEL